MLPISLTLQGLYSYKTRQTIDFRALTSDHLFGIFGAVGSGKSSILDAITFVLYDEVERISGRDRRNQNLFNQQSEEFLIDFEFESGPEGQLYRFLVRNSRTKKGEPKNFERAAYIWKSGDWSPLPNTDASQIFNLSYDNFKRTVIIPQGRFQEFLQLGGKDRTQMLMELFPKVAEFDLQEKIAVKRKATELELATLTGNLEALGPISIANLETEHERIAEAETQLKTQETDCNQADLAFRSLENVRLVFEELQKATEALALLEKDKFTQEQKRAELDRYERIFKTFDSDLKLTDNAKEVADKANRQLEFTQNEAAKISELLQKAKVDHDRAKSFADQLPAWELEVADWKLASRIVKQKQEKAADEALEQAIKANLQTKTNVLAGQEKELQSAKEELESAETQAADVAQLLEAEACFKEEARLQKTLAEQSQKLKQCDDDLLQLKAKKELALPAQLMAILPGATPDSKMGELLHLLAEARMGLEQKIHHFQAQKEELLKREQLFNFTTQLTEGEPCPLCGSVHHPEVISAEDVSVQQKENDNELVNTTQLIKDVGHAETLLSGLQAELKGVLETQKALIAEQNSTITNQEELHRQYATNPFVAEGAKNAKVLLEANQKNQNIRLQLKAELKKLELQMADAVPQLEALRLQQNELNQKLASADGLMQAWQQQLTTLKTEDWNGQTTASIGLRITGLESKITAARSAFESTQTALQSIESQFMQITTTLHLQKSSADQTTAEYDTLSKRTGQKIASSGLGDEDFIRQILGQNLDTMLLRNELEKFFNALLTAGERVRNLKEKSGTHPFDETLWQEAKQNSTELRAAFDREKGNFAVLQSNLQTLKQNLKKQAELNEKVGKLELRQTNLNTLYNLFKGQAFVNYASGVYLKNIVEMANQRFFRLTRQRLRLVLDGDNNFYVKDFLNGGHERLAKTLSGGQTFQASLSLALALADNVRHLTQSPRNFFFLDEGFGSLDKEALSLVFDTLRQLRHENRIVGIISHVEEMQQEIDTCLMVSLDEENGSKVEMRV